ncbi:hypothetical protein [Candidatus Magnetobacterium casense]|uniref:Uncharacterized protein n=1 Tax=Candidatus Magnetobacterium casense TaxID=1455061 RepID=A0ABS6S383_9BACT|nr:hypothetical protein [Candidatus Magnetobacterium casensis]MBV6342818.1 hypothetical protein [Candidatus Magnetobacterium casensis]
MEEKKQCEMVTVPKKQLEALEAAVTLLSLPKSKLVEMILDGRKLDSSPSFTKAMDAFKCEINKGD